MYSSELITLQHLARKAVIYIRQSTPHQVVNHQESLRLQYALHDRARQLGPDPGDRVVDGRAEARVAHRHRRHERAGEWSHQHHDSDSEDEVCHGDICWRVVRAKGARRA